VGIYYKEYLSIRNNIIQEFVLIIVLNLKLFGGLCAIFTLQQLKPTSLFKLIKHV